MRQSVKKKNNFSDAELLSFALKDVKPFPGRRIKTNIKQNTNSMSSMSENLVVQNTSNIEDIRIWVDKDGVNPTDDLKIILD